jgi:hypothetical protein
MPSNFEVDAAGRGKNNDYSRIRLSVEFIADDVKVDGLASMSIAEIVPDITDTAIELFSHIDSRTLLDPRVAGLVADLKTSTTEGTWPLTQHTRAYPKKNPFQVIDEETSAGRDVLVEVKGNRLAPLQYMSLTKNILKSWEGHAPYLVKENVERLYAGWETAKKAVEEAAKKRSEIPMAPEADKTVPATPSRLDRFLSRIKPR